MNHKYIVEKRTIKGVRSVGFRCKLFIYRRCGAEYCIGTYRNEEECRVAAINYYSSLVRWDRNKLVGNTYEKVCR